MKLRCVTAINACSLRGSLVLLDRDGVINTDVGSPGVLSVDDLTLIPGSATAVAKLKLAGASVCVVTNQTCVGKGLLTEEGLAEIHHRLRDLLVLEGGAAAQLDDILWATKAANMPCHRRKPAPGMLLEALDAFDMAGRDSTGRLVAMIGDSITDMQAAASAGVTNRIMVSTGHGKEVLKALRAHGVCGSTPLLISTTENHPGNILPPEILPLTFCANLSEAVDAMMLGS